MTLTEIANQWENLSALFGFPTSAKRDELVANKPSRSACEAALNEADAAEKAIRENMAGLELAKQSARKQIARWNNEIAKAEAERAHHLANIDHLDKQVQGKLKALRDNAAEKRAVMAAMSHFGYRLPDHEGKEHPNDYVRLMKTGFKPR
jgi:chromosome segregation ATPase